MNDDLISRQAAIDDENSSNDRENAKTAVISNGIIYKKYKFFPNKIIELRSWSRGTECMHEIRR